MYPYHSNRTAPETNPAPKALMAIISPLFRSPFLLHSSSRIGQHELEEFPWSSMLVGNFSAGCSR